MEEYNFTEEEIEVVQNYLFRKICKLEESSLTDSYCYPHLVNFRRKLLGRGVNDKKISKTNKSISNKL